MKALDGNDAELRNLIRALVRYHFSEWHYNSHFGGDPLEALLMRENPITSFQPHWHSDRYDEVVQGFFDTGYEDYDKGISLFAGYQDYVQQPLLEALKTSTDPALDALQRKLLTTNYFLLEDEVRSLLKPHMKKLERHIRKGESLYRARIGYELKARPNEDWGKSVHYKPYSAAALGAPPPHLAGSGRLNRPGVSYLYLATDEMTALSEVRPHPGHHVSVGAFKCLKKVRVADFNAISIRDYCRSDKALDQYLLLKTIDELFSLPVPPEERGRYSFTQFLSDALRHLGFEGVGFKSSVGTGANFTVFDPRAFKYVADSAKVLRVEQLEYRVATTETVKSDGDYLTGPDGKLI
ncbi:MAG: RES family NAD+ phosphorylase [Gemmataceae bacterium]